MKRRQLFKFAGACALVALPLKRGAQATRLPVVGILAPRVAGDPPVAAFVAKLAELGHVDGRTVRIERRMIDGGREAYAAAAAELVKLGVDVLFAASTASIDAVIKATKTIPVVFETFNDPVANGFVKSLSRPGGNVTGVAGIEAQLAPKRLALIKEAVPRTTRVAVLRNPQNVNSAAVAAELGRAAKKLGVKLVYVNVQKASELEAAFITIVRKHRVDVLLLLTDPLFSTERGQIIQLAEKVHLPAIYPFSGMAEGGGLMVYGPNQFAMYRDAAVYVDKILKGTKPGSLPVAQPTQFDLVINARTAMALGLTFPQTLLVRADSVIQ